MKTEQQQVKEFMILARHPCPDRPEMSSLQIRKLRVRLIAEELMELAGAYNLKLEFNCGPKFRIEDKTNIIDSYDAILDLLYVVIGGAVEMGLDIEPGWQEVHRSNMTKFIDGHRREDGKWIKGPSYSPAQLEPIIYEQTQVLHSEGNHGEHSQDKSNTETRADMRGCRERQTALCAKIAKQLAAESCNCEWRGFVKSILEDVEKL